MSNTPTFLSVAPALPDYTFHQGRTIVWEPWIVAAPALAGTAPPADPPLGRTGLPTIALGLPGLGLWALAYPWRLYTTLCSEADCENPRCEVAEFYRTKEVR